MWGSILFGFVAFVVGVVFSQYVCHTELCGVFDKRTDCMIGNMYQLCNRMSVGGLVI